VLTLLENEGRYPGDPPAVRIYAYRHANTGRRLYAIFWRVEDDDVHASPFVVEPTLLMEYGVLSRAGEAEIVTLKEMVA
jgi:hypothetical protein